MAPLIPRRRLLLFVVLGLLVLGTLLALVVRRRGTLVEAALRDWLIGEVAGATDSVYYLSAGRLRLNLLSGHIRIDTLRLATDTARNDFRADPYPVLAATASGCRVTGIDTWGLLTARGVKARLFRCEEITATVREKAGARATGPAAAADPRGGIPFLRDSLKLPALLPLIVLHRTELPSLSLDYSRRKRDGSETHVAVTRLSLELRGTRVDPAVPPAARKPFFSELAVVTGTALEAGSAARAVALGRLRANFTDSTLALDSIVVGPPQPDAEWFQARRTRADLLRISLDSVRIEGLDYRRLGSVEGAVAARTTRLFGLGLNVTSDKRLPPGAPMARRTPQQWIAALDRPLALDSMSIAGGRIVYREHAIGRSGLGTMTWDQVEAGLTNVRTVARPGEAMAPTVITASALMLGQGRLETTIEVPLTAPQFDMTYSGSLGPMDMTALNAFVAEVLPARITSGKVQSVRFSVAVRNGRSVGRVVPIYRDFKLKLEDKKGNFIKKAGLSIVTVFANAFKVRGENPGGPGKKPVIGSINYPYTATASLPQVFWFALRGGLGKVFLQ